MTKKYIPRCLTLATILGLSAAHAGEFALGDWGGARTALSDKGIDFTLGYTAEVFGNVSGGLRQGAAFNGLFELGIDFDFEKLAGLKGLTGHVNGFIPSGESFSGHYGGDLGTISNLEFYNSARMFEAWLQQDFLDGKLSIRAGSLALDEEFVVSEYSALFLNASFGADTAMSANMPVPIYAITSPGIRFKLQSTERLYLQAALYDGNPAPGFFGDPSAGAATSSEANRHGTDWSLRSSEGSLWIVEVGYVVNAPGEEKADEAAGPHAHAHNAESHERSHGTGEKHICCGSERGLFGSYKLGYAHHTDAFLDYAALSRGALRNKSRNSALYAVVDQELFREARTEDQGLGLFARAMFVPESQNTVAYAVEAGLVYKGLFPGRDEDTIGLGFAHLHISADFARATDPRLDHEQILELTYSAQLTPWLSIQPDVQYIIHPGASNALSDEWAVGLRASVAF